MKKIICILLCALLLSGCMKDGPSDTRPASEAASAEPSTVPADAGSEEATKEATKEETKEATKEANPLAPVFENRAVGKIPVPVLMEAMKRADEAEDAELGTGIYAADLTEEGVLDGEFVEIYPFFKEGKLDALFLNGHVKDVVEDEKALQEVENMLDQPFMLVFTGVNLVFVSPDRITRLWGDETTKDPADNRQLQFLLGKEMKKNPIGNKRLPVGKSTGKGEVQDPESGKKYSNSRIVVTLKESSDAVIEKIEQELGVKLFRKQNKGKTCVFITTEPKSYAALKALAEKAVKIEGVEKAVLDGVNDRQSRIRVNPTAWM
ncbi:MAG: hypothetical protein IKI54_04780 [Lachnospiraceae bacterium]|nr:hypothetical protein [Lachnospiraceae bacterium]